MLASRLLQSLNLVTSVMSRIPLVLVVAFAAGAHATPCANDADFVSDGTFGDGVLTCADTERCGFFIYGRDSEVDRVVCRGSLLRRRRRLGLWGGTQPLRQPCYLQPRGHGHHR